jgi:hypothetical protein
MRTVMMVARALLDFASMPRHFWPEACRHSVYLLNRRPHSALGGQTPEFRWSGCLTNLETFRAFGCEVWRHIPVSLRRKLDDRADRCASLGVETAGKGFRLWSFSGSRIVSAVSVSFNESIMPFAGDDSGTSEGRYETFVLDAAVPDPAPDSVPDAVPAVVPDAAGSVPTAVVPGAPDSVPAAVVPDAPDAVPAIRFRRP